MVEGCKFGLLLSQRYIDMLIAECYSKHTVDLGEGYAIRATLDSREDEVAAEDP